MPDNLYKACKNNDDETVELLLTNSAETYNIISAFNVVIQYEKSNSILGMLINETIWNGIKFIIKNDIINIGAIKILLSYPGLIIDNDDDIFLYEDWNIDSIKLLMNHETFRFNEDFDNEYLKVICKFQNEDILFQKFLDINPKINLEDMKINEEFIAKLILNHLDKCDDITIDRFFTFVCRHNLVKIAKALLDTFDTVELFSYEIIIFLLKLAIL
jgi:hypothetical protein